MKKLNLNSETFQSAAKASAGTAAATVSDQIPIFFF